MEAKATCLGKKAEYERGSLLATAHVSSKLITITGALVGDAVVPGELVLTTDYLQFTHEKCVLFSKDLF